MRDHQDDKGMSVPCKEKCATCPFREGSPYEFLAPMLAEKSMTESRICHSTGDSVFYGETGRPERACRGSRDLQLRYLHGAGLLREPTDEAWEETFVEVMALTQGTSSDGT